MEIVLIVVGVIAVVVLGLALLAAALIRSGSPKNTHH